MLVNNVHRSYKYKMYVPSLRLERSELKCKSGCDYFGNPQWKGYCSKCHREQMQRQRTTRMADNVEDSPVALATPPPAAERRDRERGKPTQSSFSKFEEKRLRQTDSLKKTNILKFNVFRKTNAEEQEKESGGGEGAAAAGGVSVPASVLEAQRRDFCRRFGALGASVERDLRRFVYNFIQDVLKHAHTKSIDELSERVQCHYQLFVRRMESSAHYADVDADTRELLIDFVEKHAMTYLHSHVFSLGGAEEERADRRMQARIRQLGWLCPQHLDCRITHTHAHCRQLLYDAINELMSMDGRLSPGGKLTCVRRCCACVVALVSAAAGAPASADDLLPALIFTVLKANPPRLVSNINFVTRFCNASRLMTGERGYYFTNLCCAVSFIENLTAESLSMPRDQFNCYMTMPATIGGSSWAAALSLCDNAREATAQRRACVELDARAVELTSAARTLHADLYTFHDEIGKKATTVLERTPLEIKPHEPPPGLLHLLPPLPATVPEPTARVPTPVRLATPQHVSTPEQEAQLETPLPASHALIENLTCVKTEPEGKLEATVRAPPARDTTPKQGAILEAPVLAPDACVATLEQEANLEALEPVPRARDVTPASVTTPARVVIPDQEPNMEQSLPSADSQSHLVRPNHLSVLESVRPAHATPPTASPCFPLTPDEFGTPDELAPTLTDINYDIDLSDLSADNSAADEPLSLAPLPQPLSPSLPRQPPSLSLPPQHLSLPLPPHPPSLPVPPQPLSLLDDNDSPSTAGLLPAPLQPSTAQ